MDGLLSDDSGVPVDLTAYAITSELRWGTSLVTTLVVTKANQGTSPGGFTLSSPSTSAWPTASLSCDLKFIDGAGMVQHSDTFVMQVEPAVTS